MEKQMQTMDDKQAEVGSEKKPLRNSHAQEVGERGIVDTGYSFYHRS